MAAVQETVEKVRLIDVDQYKYGFETLIESDKAPKGLSEDTVRFISNKKNEPAWMLEWRLDAYRRWLTMREPDWARVEYPKIDYQDAYYYSAPVQKVAPKSLDEIDPEILKTYEKLGIPLREQEMLAGVVREDGGTDPARRVAVDAVFDSVSVATTFKEELKKAGVIFMPISEAIREHPDLVKKYLGSVVPVSDNFFATLNSAVFSDGSFVYVPPGVRCPMELSTYFRINEKNTGQFERTLIIADKGSYVSYLEGCTAPRRDENQLHAAVVELVALDDAEIKYSTVQNWYPGDAEGRGGIFNFVTKRGDCRGRNSKISWTQVETGSAITWKYPSCILRGDNSRGEFYSIAISNGRQQVDSGTKMIHLGRNTTSRIISKGIAAGRSNNTYRGLVSAHRRAVGARNFTNCDSLLIGDKCGAHTVPYIEAKTPTAVFEHEATTSKISEETLFYCMQRGLSQEEAVALVVNGFVRDVLQQLPMEFAVEAQKLISISLEGRWDERIANLVPDRRGARRRRGQWLTKENNNEFARNQESSGQGRRSRDPQGLDLTVNKGEVHAIMGPNGSGKSTLAHVLSGKPGYEVTGGSVTFDGADLLELGPDQRAARGIFLAFQYPLEIPGVATMTFLRTALNAQRKTRGEPELSTPEFLKRVREMSAKLSINQEMLRRPVNVGFSGGEKKRNEILQMALLEPVLAVLDETDSGPRHRCPQGGRRRRQPAALARPGDDRHHPLSAASRLHRARHRARAVEGPHRSHRRQGTRPRARSRRLCAVPGRGGVTP